MIGRRKLGPDDSGRYAPEFFAALNVGDVFEWVGLWQHMRGARLTVLATTPKREYESYLWAVPVVIDRADGTSYYAVSAIGPEWEAAA